jgi:beta-1,2-mannobiose phosphorylase / 1,2-beta-oligomannan phosphorylase
MATSIDQVLSGLRMERLGVVMTPDPDDPNEAWGVLNPASARDRDGEVYLFPRLVAVGNRSRVGRARVQYDADGAPCGVERLGVVLEPEETWEQNQRTAGVEDPRITFLPAVDAWVMTYTAYGPLGPRIALAVARDLASWERLGPVSFGYEAGLRADLNLYPNKDAVLFPEPVPGPAGPSYALLHRPMWDLGWLIEGEGEPLPRGLDDPRPGIWVSYTPAAEVESDPRALLRLRDHRLVALPEHPWEELKIGAGPPPLRIDGGWLLLHHGVTGELARGTDLQQAVHYAAGALLLSEQDVGRVLARSAEPLLAPETDGERDGIVPNVVFPTALEPRDDGSADVFYGMADSRIGAARLTL